MSTHITVIITKMNRSSSRSLTTAISTWTQTREVAIITILFHQTITKSWCLLRCFTRWCPARNQLVQVKWLTAYIRELQPLAAMTTKCMVIRDLASKGITRMAKVLHLLPGVSTLSLWSLKYGRRANAACPRLNRTLSWKNSSRRQH